MESSAFSLILCAIRNLQFFTLYQSSSLMTNLIKCEPDTLKMIQNSLDLKNKLFLQPFSPSSNNCLIHTKNMFSEMLIKKLFH